MSADSIQNQYHMLRDFLELLDFAEHLLDSVKEDKRELTRIYTYISCQISFLPVLLFVLKKTQPSLIMCLFSALGTAASLISIIKLVRDVSLIRRRIVRDSSAISKAIGIIREVKATILDDDAISAILKEGVRLRVEQFGI